MMHWHRGLRARAGWGPLVACTLVLAVLLGLTTTVQGPTTPGRNTLQWNGHRDHVQLADFPGTFALYNPPELYGGGSPAETCYTCQANAVEGGGSPATSVDPNADVDAGTGNFSTTDNLFDVGAIGGDLGETITYNSQLAQAESLACHSNCYAGAYGWGFTSTLNRSLNYSSGVATLNEPNGAAITFSQPVSGSDGCGLGDYQDIQKYTIAGSVYPMCAPLRTDGQVGYFPTYSSWKFEQSGGATVDIFDSTYGTLQYIGTNNTDAPGVNLDLRMLYNILPGHTGSWDGHTSTPCPSDPGVVSCTIEMDSAGRQVTQEVTGASTISKVDDPNGASYDFNYNSSATLASVTAPDGGVTNYTYNSTMPAPYQYEMQTVEDPDQHTTTLYYITSSTNEGLINGEKDPAGALTQYAYTYSCGACLGADLAQVTNVTYPEAVNNEIDVNHYYEGLLTSSALGPATSPGSGALSTTNADYRTWTYNYDFPTASNQNGPTTEIIVHPGAAQSTQTSVMTTDAVGNVITAQDVNGNTATSMYNDTGGNNLSELCWTAAAGSTIPSNASCTNPPSRSLSNDVVTSYTYDSFGHKTSMTDPLGNTTRYGYYVTSGLLCWVAQPTVTGTGSPCPGEGTVTASDVPVGATAYDYDAYGNQTRVMANFENSGNGGELDTQSTYNNLDELTCSLPPPGQSQPQGDCTANPVTNPFATTYSYGSNYLVQTKDAPDGQTDFYNYDGDGKVIADTNAMGLVTSNAYDADERTCWTVTSTTNYSSQNCTSPPSGSSQVLSYVNGTDAPLQTKDPNGNVTTYYYSDAAYPTSPTEVQDPASNEITYNTYDAYGDVCLAGPAYNPNWDTTSQCNWASGDTADNYNAAGTLLSTEDPLGNTTTYQHTLVWDDTAVTGSTNPLNQTTSYGYDADGHQISTTEPGAQVVSTGFNADSLPCWEAPVSATNSCSSPPSGVGVTVNSYNGLDLRSQMVDNSGTASPLTTTYSYTSGQMTSVTDSNHKTVSYLYGYAGEVDCIAYPVAVSTGCGTLGALATPSTTNTVVDRNYDQMLRLKSYKDWLGNTTSFGYTDATYPNDVTSVTYPASTGVVANYGYDTAGNLQSASYSTPNYSPQPGTQSDSWTYNTDNQKLTTSFNNATTSPNVTYNSYRQVTNAETPGNSANDTYAVATNSELLKDTTPSGSSTSYAYNAGSELCWSAANTSNTGCSNAPSGATTYAFNTNGQRQSQTTGSTITAYGWNPYGQMCWSGQTSNTTAACSSPPTGTTSYTYNGDKLRMTATTGSTTTAFTWDMVTGGSMPLDINDSANSYLYGPQLFGGAAPIEQISSSGQASFLVSNPTGVQAVVSSLGQLQEQATYSLYGTKTVAIGSSTASPFGFQGSYTDTSGLIYLINRYYDPATGQFLSVDPAVSSTGQPYAFTGGNPLNASDPLGMMINIPQGAAQQMVTIYVLVRWRPFYAGKTATYRGMVRMREHIRTGRLTGDPEDQERVITLGPYDKDVAPKVEEFVKGYEGFSGPNPGNVAAAYGSTTHDDYDGTINSSAMHDAIEAINAQQDPLTGVNADWDKLNSMRQFTSYWYATDPENPEIQNMVREQAAFDPLGFGEDLGNSVGSPPAFEDLGTNLDAI